MLDPSTIFNETAFILPKECLYIYIYIYIYKKKKKKQKKKKKTLILRACVVSSSSINFIITLMVTCLDWIFKTLIDVEKLSVEVRIVSIRAQNEVIFSRKLLYFFLKMS